MVAQAHTTTSICRATLRGLEGVEVRVARLQPEVERTGVSAQHLTTAVEGQLRQAGIPVLTAHEALTMPGRPSLSLHVHITPHAEGLPAYTISVALQQRVSLETDAALATVSTWSVGSTGRLGSARLSVIRNTVRDHVDQFISAYLSVNPVLQAVQRHRPRPHAATLSARSSNVYRLSASTLERLTAVWGHRPSKRFRWLQNA